MRRIISFTLGFLLILNTMLFFTYGENIDSVEKYRNEKYDDYIKNIENNEKYDEKIAPMEYSYNEKYISDTAKNSVARASLNLPKNMIHSLNIIYKWNMKIKVRGPIQQK